MGFGKSIYKTPAQLRAMVAPGELTAAALVAVRAEITAGATGLHLNAVAERVIRAGGGVPNFMKEPGYHHTICVSVNDAVVHGIPTDTVFAPGDIVSIDCGAELGGWNGDSAITVVIPDPARPELVAQREKLSLAAENAMWAGIAALASSTHLNEIGSEIEEAALAVDSRYGMIEDYVGHGIGRSMHEDPPVFNYRVSARGPRIKSGLVIAIEPMVTGGGIDTHTLADGWTVVTDDGTDAAHWEHSIAVHDGGLWVLTAPDGGLAGLKPWGITPVPLSE